MVYMAVKTLMIRNPGTEEEFLNSKPSFLIRKARIQEVMG
jgi:hypothetical protein